MSKRTVNIKNKKILIAAVVLAAIVAISALISESVWNSIFVKAGLAPKPYVSAPMTVHFVDVGQGDCTLITTDKGETILIDSGEEIKAQNVINYLKNLSVNELDYCIVTHPHSDHYGGMLKIINEVPAKRVIMPKLSGESTPTDSYYKSFVSYAKNNCKGLYFVSSYQKINLSEAELELYPPVSQDDELNEMSLVVKASYKDGSFLITGDCSESEEKELMRKYSADEFNANVLKAGHHGSKTSSSDEWLDAVKPDICVITAGKYNSYDLPHEDTIEKLEKRKIKILRTDICGNIVFDCDEETITMR